MSTQRASGAGCGGYEPSKPPASRLKPEVGGQSTRGAKDAAGVPSALNQCDPFFFSVAIRADASHEMGGGHIGRCLALAEALRAKGAEVTFLCRSLPGHHIADVEARGFAVERLADETPDTAVAVLERLTPDWLVVDHYELEAAWERAVRRKGMRVLAFDDGLRRDHACDALLDPACLDPEKYRGRVPTGAALLMGPGFALLRSEFTKPHSVAEADTERRALRVLVFFSRADRALLSAVAVEAAQFIDQTVELHLIPPTDNHDAATMVEQASTMANVVVHPEVDDMAALMRTMDFAVGGGGVSLWERCAVGLPSLVVTLAENQRATNAAAIAAGAALSLGEAAEVTPEALAGAILSLADDGPARARMAEAGRMLVDGRGAKRLAALLGPVDMRPAKERDAETLWTWANDPATRASAFSTDAISWEDHRSWLDRSLNAADCLILIAEDTEGPCGQVRFDMSDGAAELDIAVAPGRRGGGLGLEILLKGVSGLRALRPDVVRIFAEVKRSNVASRRMFLSAGFQRATPLRPDADRFVLPRPSWPSMPERRTYP